uniref:Aspartate beta-hydroxylase domain containing 1 n=2 Tax=Sus scrofa TaxID=9823 RepID=A0A8D1HRS3_PIG
GASRRESERGRGRGRERENPRVGSSEKQGQEGEGVGRRERSRCGGRLVAGSRRLVAGSRGCGSRWGLKIPPGCELVVGGEPQCWAEGHCLLVDDSFLHTVAHNGSPEDGPRVVFIVDLWHPNVAGAERQALDFVFAPDP